MKKSFTFVVHLLIGVRSLSEESKQKEPDWRGIEQITRNAATAYHGDIQAIYYEPTDISFDIVFNNIVDSVDFYRHIRHRKYYYVHPPEVVVEDQPHYPDYLENLFKNGREMLDKAKEKNSQGIFKCWNCHQKFMGSVDENNPPCVYCGGNTRLKEFFYHRK